MKINNYQLLFLGIVIAFSACKKSEEPSLKNPGSQSNPFAAVSDTHLPLTVVTIAGNPVKGIGGFADGVGTNARFNSPVGIDLLDDGTMYIADMLNHKIRKISPTNTVSTIDIPASATGEALRQPMIVRVAKDGTINILEGEYPAANVHKIWILKPTGELLTPLYHQNDNHYYDIEKDPYNSFMWICGVTPIYMEGNILTGFTGDLEKFRIDKFGAIGTESYAPPVDSLTSFDQTTPSFKAFFCGYNGVKYMAISQNLYKLTPGGVFSRIYRDLFASDIYSIVATKDSRTLYVSVNGTIYSLSNGKVKYLVGPHAALNGADGVGKNADVSAFRLALSKDESTLYFTDFVNNSVRKLLLR